MAGKLIRVSQGKIGRWQYGDESCGLYTDGFYNCLIVIFRSENKISLSHVDPSVTLKDLKTELAWVGEPAEAIIYYKDSEHAGEAIEDLFKSDAAFKSRFEMSKINPMRVGGKIIPCDSGKILPDGTPLPEFDSDIIWVNKKHILAVKKLKTEYKLVSTDDTIKMIYSRLQDITWQTGIKKGSDQRVATFEIQCRLDANRDLSFSFFMRAMRNDVVFIQEAIESGRITSDVKIINPKGVYYTLLTIAAAEGFEDMVVMLLKHNANPNLPMQTGSTPLFVAAGRGHIRIVERLLVANADPTIATKHGMFPYANAFQAGHHAICQLLEKSLAPKNSNAYWIVTTKNKDADGAQFAQNFFVNTAQDKNPLPNTNCFTIKEEAKTRLAAIFDQWSIAQGGARKAFIFEFSQPPIELAGIFRDKKDSSALKYVGFDEYTYDRSAHKLVPVVKAEASVDKELSITVATMTL